MGVQRAYCQISKESTWTCTRRKQRFRVPYSLEGLSQNDERDLLKTSCRWESSRFYVDWTCKDWAQNHTTNRDSNQKNQTRGQEANKENQRALVCWSVTWRSWARLWSHIRTRAKILHRLKVVQQQRSIVFRVINHLGEMHFEPRSAVWKLNNFEL